MDTFSQSYTGIMGFREEDHRGKSTILNTSYQRYILSTWLIIADVDLNYLAQISTRLVQAGLLSLARALSLSLRHTHTHTHTRSLAFLSPSPASLANHFQAVSNLSLMIKAVIARFLHYGEGEGISRLSPVAVLS